MKYNCDFMSHLFISRPATLYTCLLGNQKVHLTVWKTSGKSSLRPHKSDVMEIGKCVSVFVCVCVRAFLCVCVRFCVCLRACAFGLVCVCMCACISMTVCLCLFVCVCLRACVCVQVRLCLQALTAGSPRSHSTPCLTPREAL